MTAPERIPAPVAAPILGVPLRTVQAPERIRLSEAAVLLGLSLRQLRERAANGEIPKAARIGRAWTFNVVALQHLAATPAAYQKKRGGNHSRQPAFLPPQPGDDCAREYAGPADRVYVVGYGSYVKIGFSSTALEKRLKALQTSSPKKLIVFGSLSGGFDVEAALHRKFARHRLNGEWFYKRGAIARWIAAGCPRPNERRCK